MRRLALFPIAIVIAAACGGPSRDRAPQRPARSASAPASSSSGPGVTALPATSVAAAAAPAAIPPTSTWRTPAQKQGPLYVVAEGHCPAMTVSAIEGAVLVGYRHGIARADDRGVLDDPLPSQRQKLRGFGKVQGFVGRWPDRAYVLYDNDGRCDNRVYAGRWRGSEWQPVLDKGHANTTLDPATFSVTGDGALAVGLCGSCGGAPEGCHDMLLADGVTLPPQLTIDGLEYVRMAAAPTGEVFVLGQVCNPKDRGLCNLVMRRWAPGGKVATDYLGPGAYAQLHVVSGSEVYVTSANGYWAFDGAKLARAAFPPGFKEPYLARAEGQGVLLFRDRDEKSRKVVRRNKDGSTEDLTNALPEVQPRKLSDLPAPVFSDTGARFTSLEGSASSPDGGEWVVASYVEKRAGWYEFEMRRALLHDKPPAEVVRCASRSTWGYEAVDVPKPFVSWPPPVGDDCAHPHVVVMDLSATTPATWDFPKLRALFRARPELGVTEILEIDVAGRRHVAVRTPTPDLARRAAEAAARNVPMTKPETACGEPRILRRVPVQ